MRLIDADKLHYIRKLFEDSDKSEVVVFAKEIDKVQTVKAIPIEWMKNYARKICADDGGRYNSKAYGIDRMIYDWEKENETN